MLVTKLRDKKQYLTLIIISDILLFLIPHYQMQRRELRLSVRNKDARSGSKDGSQVAGAPRLTNNPRKIKKMYQDQSRSGNEATPAAARTESAELEQKGAHRE